MVEPSGAQEVYEVKKFDKEEWKEITDGHTFNEKLEEPENPNMKEPPDVSWLAKLLNKIPVGLFVLLKWIFLALIGLGLIYLIFYIVSNAVKTPSNTKIKVLFDEETLEENIHELDLNQILQKYIQEQNYKRAIRVLYLIAIKELSNKSWIKWKKDKTNYEYVLEMQNKPNHHGPFNELTYIYEWVWYGGHEVEEDTYRNVGPKFNQFMHTLTQSAVEN